MADILITGFDPFGGEKINPAWEAVKLLPDRIEGLDIFKTEIPTVFGLGAERVLEAYKKEKPSYIFLIGQAGGRSSVTPETRAYNEISARIADNAGNKPDGIKVIDGGEDILYTSVPVVDIVQEMKNDVFNIEVSDSAGRFVCNELFYRVLYMVGEKAKVDFVHVPYLPEQAGDGVPSMELSEIKDTLQEYIKRTVK